MRQPADEADRVGDEIAAALVLEAARRRVERLEQPVADGDAGVGERVEERRLAGVRVAGERDGRRLGAAALLAADVALAARAPRSRSRSSVTRRRASRRSVSSCDSPGPRVPTPPPSRSRCCHIPRMRGRLYSSCASSTWSFPSALTACWAKMSRISCVRSTTRAWSAFSSVRCCDGLSSSSTSSTSAARVAVRLLQLLELALADVRARVGHAPVLDDPRRPARRRAVRASSSSSASSSAPSAPGASTARTSPRSGSGRRRAIGLSHRHPTRHYDSCRADSRSRRPDARARRRPLGEPSRGARRWSSCASLLPGEPLYDDGEAIVWGDAGGAGRPRRTSSTRCRRRGTCPGRIDGRRRARPRRERHEGRRRGDARARARRRRRRATSSSRARRSRSRRARCPALFASGVLAGVELAVVLEPTDCDPPRRLPRQPPGARRVPRRERALRPAVDGPRTRSTRSWRASRRSPRSSRSTSSSTGSSTARC